MCCLAESGRTCQDLKQAALKGKITKLETFFKNFRESSESKIELQVNLKATQSALENLKLQYYVLPPNTDLSEVEAEIESLEARVEKLE